MILIIVSLEILLEKQDKTIAISRSGVAMFFITYVPVFVESGLEQIN